MSAGTNDLRCPVAGRAGRADQDAEAAPVGGRTDAVEFLRLLEREGLASGRGRLEQVLAEIDLLGTYTQTAEELLWGARIAWRNTPRCIGKFYWKALTVRDMRHLDSAQDVFDALVEHLRLAFGSGKIKLMMTVFAAREPGRDGIRIWNPQLVRYAGHRGSDGRIVGDPETADFTDAVRALGWSGGTNSRFDVLPVVIQMPGEAPRVFELPADVVHEVPLTHPRFPGSPTSTSNGTRTRASVTRACRSAASNTLPPRSAPGTRPRRSEHGTWPIRTGTTCCPPSPAEWGWT
jgi:Nitric oxide synthase, oxygenase domain